LERRCWREIGIRNNQNIFRKIIRNNSENKQELSYTPQNLSLYNPRLQVQVNASREKSYKD
jgi:hypothetical protein